MCDNDYSYDIYFRMAVIDEFLNGNDKIWDLYNRMQYIRCSSNGRIPKNMMNHQEEFKELIKNFQVNGFDFAQPILINKKGMIVDGAHRMACALYFDSPEVSVYTNSEYKDFIPNDYSKKWFEEHLKECIPYAEKEKQMVKGRYHV